MTNDELRALADAAGKDRMGYARLGVAARTEVLRLLDENDTLRNALMSIVSYDGKLDGYEAARTWRTASDALKAVKP